MSLNEPFERHQLTTRDGVNADAYWVPLDLFGEGVPEEFFAILGRLAAIDGQIEYLHERLNHLPGHERVGVRNVE